jgi:hypothetical protein
MLDSTDSTYFTPSLSELYAEKIEIDETADTPQPAPSHLSSRGMKSQVAKRQLQNNLIENDETADAPQPAPFILGTRCMKPKAHRRKLKDYRNHGGPHHCGRRPSPDPTRPNKRPDLLEKAHAIELIEKDETEVAVQ